MAKKIETFIEFRKELYLQNAKMYGYKNTKEALKDGMYGVRSVSCSVDTMKKLMNISEFEAQDFIYKWRQNGEVTYSQACGLNEIYFKKE